MVASLLLVIVLIPADKMASAEPATEADSEKIRITADKLTTNSVDKYAEFIGNVKVTQGATKIEADRLKIHYHAELDAQGVITAGEESIHKITAQGNVQIWFDDRFATTAEAEYLTGDQILVLKGANSKVVSGKNSISGARITLYRSEERITVEGSEKQRVEAEFFSGDIRTP
jgi:lipopolysaccharide export system protein LptA